jgi:hypothetical protein
MAAGLADPGIGGSGIAFCSPPALVTTQGRGQVVSGTVRDTAGRTATVSVTLNIDKTPPTITPAVAPPPTAAGWNNTDATVTFQCADALSGVTSCSGPQPVTRDGAGQRVTGTATDAAGNTATAAATVNIDKTAPTITATLSAPANAAGWHKAPVTVTFACQDVGSGIASCPPPVTVAAEGASQEVRGVAVDRAGNSVAAAVRVSLDTSPPVVRFDVAPPASAAGWHAGDVTVAFACEDVLSGVADCPAPRSLRNEGADQPVSVTVADRAGNVATATATIRIDRTPPAITAAADPPPNAAGWHRAPVTVSFACSDALSGIADCAAPVTVVDEGAGIVARGLAHDRAGNTANATVTVNLDRTPPAIRAIASAGSVSNADVTVQFECDDAESGVATCPAPVVVTAEGLSQTVEGVATDRAGNTARASVSVSIDRTGPTIVAAVTPAANAAGWNNGPVTVTFTCGDTGSGVTDCPAPVVLETEGAAQAVSGTARDQAGNQTSTTVTINIDRTPPTIQAAASASEWTNADVGVQFACADALSGIAQCQGPVTVTAEGEYVITGAATDAAGNAATASTTVKVDKTAPSITGALDRAPNGAGWFNAPVTATFTCLDDRSGIVDCPARPASARRATLSRSADPSPTARATPRVRR